MYRTSLFVLLSVLFVFGVARGVSAQTPLAPDVCPGLERIVPRAVIDSALDNPEKVSGWGVPANRSLRPSRFNTTRTWLSIRNPNVPSHPLFNGVVFASGCQIPAVSTRPCDDYWTAKKGGGWIAYNWIDLPAIPVAPFREAHLCGIGAGKYLPIISKGKGNSSAFCSCTDITK